MTTEKGSVLVAGVGAEQGLGTAIARRFAIEGHPVVIAGRSAEKLGAVRDSFETQGFTVTAVVGDVSLAADVARIVAAAEALAPLVVAVHNAGGNRSSSFLDISEAEYTAHWREHALGGFHLAQAVLPGFVARAQGSLFFTGASGSLRGKANFAPFAGAKGALRNTVQSIAREFGPRNIHVAHVIVDGGIAGARLLERAPDLLERRGPDGLLDIDAIAEAYWYLHGQDRSAWTLELDLRPWSESF